MGDAHRPWHRDPLASYDRLGRKQPKQLGGALESIRAFPGLIAVFDKKVPPRHYVRDGDGHATAAVVTCPCKVSPPPRVPRNVFVRCKGSDCGRWFWFTGSEIRVATEPAGTDP